MFFFSSCERHVHNFFSKLRSIFPVARSSLCAQRERSRKKTSEISETQIHLTSFESWSKACEILTMNWFDLKRALLSKSQHAIQSRYFYAVWTCLVNDVSFFVDLCDYFFEYFIVQSNRKHFMVCLIKESKPILKIYVKELWHCNSELQQKTILNEKSTEHEMYRFNSILSHSFSSAFNVIQFCHMLCEMEKQVSNGITFNMIITCICHN